MKWVQDRSVVLGIFALATTTWLWIDFSVTYDIGTGIFSGSVLGALPSLLIFAALLGLVLTLIILMPSLLLLVDLNVKRPRLVAQQRDALSDNRRRDSFSQKLENHAALFAPSAHLSHRDSRSRSNYALVPRNLSDQTSFRDRIHEPPPRPD